MQHTQSDCSAMVALSLVLNTYSQAFPPHLTIQNLSTSVSKNYTRTLDRARQSAMMPRQSIMAAQAEQAHTIQTANSGMRLQNSSSSFRH